MFAVFLNFQKSLAIQFAITEINFKYSTKDFTFYILSAKILDKYNSLQEDLYLSS